MEKQKLKELKEKALAIEPVIRIGKNGLNNNMVAEIEKLIKKRKLIKIKILNNCPDENKTGIIDAILEKINAELIEKRGNVFAIYRK
ncbi:MAG: YhbY family RNA-binding protein [archaeon]